MTASLKAARASRNSASRRKATSSPPPFSPARTMLMYSREQGRALAVRCDLDGVVGALLQGLDDGARVGRVHDPVDGVAATFGGVVHENGHGLRRLHG